MIDSATSQSTSWSVIESFTNEIPDTSNLTATAFNALTRLPWLNGVLVLGFFTVVVIMKVKSYLAWRELKNHMNVFPGDAELEPQTLTRVFNRLSEFAEEMSAIDGNIVNVLQSHPELESQILRPIFNRLGGLAEEMSTVELGQTLLALAPYAEVQSAQLALEPIISRILTVANDMDTQSLSIALKGLYQLKNPTSHEAALVLITRIPQIAEDMTWDEVLCNVMVTTSYLDTAGIETIRPAIEALASRSQMFVEQSTSDELPPFVRALARSQVLGSAITDTIVAVAGRTLQLIEQMDSTRGSMTLSAFFPFANQHPTITAAIQALEIRLSGSAPSA